MTEELNDEKGEKWGRGRKKRSKNEQRNKENGLPIWPGLCSGPSLTADQGS